MNINYLRQQSNKDEATVKHYFSALMADGCEQQWVVKECQNEQDFREYLQLHYPFHICLYCKPSE